MKLTFEVWTGAQGGYNTRNHNLLRSPLAKTPKYQGSFRILKSDL